MKTWKPTKTQRRNFAIKMQTDSVFAANYNQRKEEKATKRRAGSEYDYTSAGGEYIPTEAQSDKAYRILIKGEAISTELRNSAELVFSAGMTGCKVHHDHIHKINSFIFN